jgi:hypothetical protein
MQKKWVLRYFMASVGLAAIGFLSLQGCGNSTGSTTEDSSASGTVAAALGGAYNASMSGGTMAMRNEAPKHSRFSILLDALNPTIKNALAAMLCPTYATTSPSAGCTVTSGVMTLSYGTTTGCSFSGSAATWTGSQTLTPASGSPSCGSFPAPTSTPFTLTRLFPPTTTRTSASGVVVTIDTAGTDAGFVTGSTQQPTAPSGGAVVTFNSSTGTRTQIAFPGINLIAASATGTAKFNHSITTTGSSATPITLSSGSVTGGTVLVFHNLVQVMGTTTFSSVSFSSGCCTPTSGTITTAFSAVSGVTPTAIGSASFVGKSETLTFTGCGTATYTGPESYSGNVTLGHCF